MKSKHLNKKAFFRDLGYEPHPGQWEVHRSNAQRRILACGVRWGKSKLAAAEALCAAMSPCDRSIGWITAPTYDLCDRVFREVVILVAENLRHRIISLKENDKRLIVRNMLGGRSEIRGKSADNAISLLGEGLNWLIIDEAAQLKPQIWEGYLSQRLIDKRGWALLISTPRGKGYYYDLYRRGQGGDPDYASWNHPSWNNPYLDKALIDQERLRLPERTFKQEYGGEFIEGSGQVFRKIREAAIGEWQKPEPNQTYYAGLDLAKIEDFTVITILNRKREVVYLDRFHRLDWKHQVNRVKAAIDQYNHACINCDTTGVGEPVYESLMMEGCHVNPYPFTQKSKAALIDNLSLLLEQELITLPRAELCPELIDELEAFQFSITEAGHVKTGAPHSYHDDTVISLALAAWHLQSRPEPTEYVGGDPSDWEIIDWYNLRGYHEDPALEWE